MGFFSREYEGAFNFLLSSVIFCVIVPCSSGVHRGMEPPLPSSRTISTQTPLSPASPASAMLRDKALRKFIRKSPFKAVSDSPFQYSIRTSMPARISVSTLPVVKLKEAQHAGGATTVISGAKRCHTIAEFNNLRNNYKNYCHYRKSGGGESSEKQLPTLPDNALNHADGLVLRASSKLSGRSRPNTPKDNTSHSGINGRAEAPSQRAFKTPRSPKKQGTPTNKLQEYEVRGTTLGRSCSSAKPDLAPKGLVEQAAQEEAPKKTGLIDSRSGPDNDQINFSSRTLIKYYKGTEDRGPQELPQKPMFDKKTLKMLVDTPSKSMRRRVTFKEEDSGLVTSYTISAQTEDSLRIGLVQPPLLLTEKNLHIFNRLSEKMAAEVPSVEEQPEVPLLGSDGVNQRVLDWVKARTQAKELENQGMVHRIPMVEQERDVLEEEQEVHGIIDTIQE